VRAPQEDCRGPIGFEAFLEIGDEVIFMSEMFRLKRSHLAEKQSVTGYPWQGTQKAAEVLAERLLTFRFPKPFSLYDTVLPLSLDYSKRSVDGPCGASLPQGTHGGRPILWRLPWRHRLHCEISRIARTPQIIQQSSRSRPITILALPCELGRLFCTSPAFLSPSICG
jgi:hypothetical protein